MMRLFYASSSRCSESNQSREDDIRVLIDNHLYEFYAPEKGITPEIQVLFFHGIERRDSSNAYLDTWKSLDGSTLWPRTWLPEKFKTARILSVAYDSSANRGNLDLYCTAENVIEDLRDPDEGVTKQESCPIVMVGKDLGCLIIQAVCLRAKDKKMSTFLNNVKGFVFYCPPLMGLPGSSGNFHGELAKKLRWGDPEISRINSDFFELKKEKNWVMKVMNAANRARRGEPIRYVPEASARLGADVFYSAGEDIHSICRPRSKTSESFAYLSRLISESICMTAEYERLTKRAVKFRLPFGDDSRYVPLEDTIKEIRCSLKENRIVVLHGAAGSGKSSLARFLALRFQESQQRGTDDPTSCFPDGILYLYCGHGEDVVNMQDQLLRMINPEHYEKYKLDLVILNSRDVGYKNRSKILTQELVGQLEPLQALLIVDDVWDHSILEGLVVPGRVKYLVTTQDLRLSRIFIDSKLVEIEPIQPNVAHQILANYAGADGSVLPSGFKTVADNLMRKTESNPLSLATLGMAVDESRRYSLDEWQGLEGRFLDRLKKEYYAPALHGRRYHSSVLTSMMLAVDTLDEDVKKLLYVIVLFEGPRVDEKLLRLFLECMEWESSLKGIDVSSNISELRDRGLVERWTTEPPVASEWVDFDGKFWTVWNIHPLRRHAILTLKKAEIGTITKFLDGKFVCDGIRYDCDLATSLVSVYGASECRQRAAEKMGNDFIWTRQEFANLENDEFGQSLKYLIPMMLRERNPSVEKCETSKTAKEVFWKIFLWCELDGARISCLLDHRHCVYWTCSFLSTLYRAFALNQFIFSVKFSDPLATKLLYLAGAEVVHETSPLKFLAESGKIEVTMARSPEILRVEVHRLAIWLSTLAIADCLTDHGLPSPVVREVVPSFLRYNPFVGEVDPRIQAGATNNSSTPDFSSPAAPQVLLNLKRIADLLATDVEHRIRAAAGVAIARLACTPAIAQILAQVPQCLETLVSLLSGNMGPLFQNLALFIMVRLTSESTHVTIPQLALCQEGATGLLAPDVDLEIQEETATAIPMRDSVLKMSSTVASVRPWLERLVCLLTTHVDHRFEELIIWPPQLMGEHESGDHGDVEVVIGGSFSGGMSAIKAILSMIRKTTTKAFRVKICQLVMKTGGREEAFVKLFRWSRVKDLQLNEFQEGLIVIDIALGLDRENSLLWRDLGVIRRVTGDLRGAAEELSKAVQMNPGHYESLKRRELVKHLQKDDVGASADSLRIPDNENLKQWGLLNDDGAGVVTVRHSRVDADSYVYDFLGKSPVQFLNFNLK